MTTSLEQFLPEVMPFVPHCPMPVAVNAVRNALIEFCDATQWLVYESPAQDILADTADYEIDTPTDATVAGILSVSFGSVTLAPAVTDMLTQYYGTDWRDQSGDPRYYVRLEQEVIRLVPSPGSALTDGLRITVATKPSQDAISCDDDLFNKWKEGIGAGAIARLLMIPQQNFTNPRLAEAYLKKFNSIIGMGKIDRNRSMTRAILRVVPGMI